MKRQETELVLGNAKCKLIIDERSSEPSVSHAHAHTNYELFYVWDGEVEIKSEDKIYHIGKNQAVLISPAHYHQTFTKENTEKFSLYISFAKTGKRVSCDVYGALESAFSSVNINVIEKGDDIGNKISSIRHLITTDCFCRDERICAVLTELLLTLYDILEQRIYEKHSVSEYKKAGIQYRYEIDTLLSQNYTKDIGLDFLAESLHLSPKRISVLIKSLYGKSFRQVKTEMRIQVAKQLLKESNLTVAQISEKVGYGSTRGFLTAFSLFTGKTPSEYREEKRKIN